jgi:hypothetical protein
LRIEAALIEAFDPPIGAPPSLNNTEPTTQCITTFLSFFMAAKAAFCHPIGLLESVAGQQRFGAVAIAGCEMNENEKTINPGGFGRRAART